MVEFPRVKSNDKEYSIIYYEKVFFLPFAPSNACRRCVLCNTQCFEISVSQDADDAPPVLNSCDIVKVPDPQMGMVKQSPTYLHTKQV